MQTRREALLNVSVIRNRLLSPLSRLGLCLFLLGSLIALSTGAEAVGPGMKGPRTPEQIVSDMTTRLGLTEEQQAQILPIIEDSVQKRKEIFEKYQGQGPDAREAMRSEMDAVRQETDEQLATVLSESQMEAHRKFMEEQREKMRNRRPGGGPRPQGMDTE